MRLAGRFSRRIRAFAKAKGISFMDCASGEKKHIVAEEYLAAHPDVCDLFLTLVSRAIAPVWDVEKSPNGTIRNLSRKQPFINHYSFHIMDREWRHITIKMSGHPPFGAQVILNGHEYVACRARKTRMSFTKEGNCLTIVSNTADLARVADTLSDSRTVGRLTEVCERWIYFCLWFALSPEDQKRSGWQYGKRRAAYDLKKLRGKKLLEISHRRYKGTAEGLRTIAAVSVLRDKVIQPLLAGAGKRKTARKPKNWSSIDEHYRTLCINMQRLFKDLGIAA